MSTDHAAALRALFPESPQYTPELVRLTFASGDPADYQSTMTVPAETFPVYAAAPDLAAALRTMVEAVQFTPLGIPAIKACETARAALAKLDR